MSIIKLFYIKSFIYKTILNNLFTIIIIFNNNIICIKNLNKYIKKNIFINI